jgi:hypothetical protein
MNGLGVALSVAACLRALRPVAEQALTANACFGENISLFRIRMRHGRTLCVLPMSPLAEIIIGQVSRVRCGGLEV